MLDLRRRLASRVLGAAALLACAASAQEPQQHTLRFTYAKDAVSWHRMTSDMAMKMAMLEQKIDTQVNIEMILHSKIVELLPGGSAKIERTVKRLKTKLSNPMMGEQTYDSNDKDADAGLMADMAVLVGVKMTMEVDGRGQVKSLKFPPEMEDKLSGQMQIEDMENMFAKESIVLPEGPIAVGGTWKIESAMPLGGGMGDVKMAHENKLVGYENGVAVIEQKVTFGEAQEIESPMGAMKVTGQPAEGKVEIELNPGWLRKSATRMKLEMSGASMQMDMDMTLNLERIEEPKPDGTAGGGESPAKDPAPKKAGGG